MDIKGVRYLSATPALFRFMKGQGSNSVRESAGHQSNTAFGNPFPCQFLSFGHFTIWSSVDHVKMSRFRSATQTPWLHWGCALLRYFGSRLASSSSFFSCSSLSHRPHNSSSVWFHGKIYGASAEGTRRPFYIGVPMSVLSVSPLTTSFISSLLSPYFWYKSVTPQRQSLVDLSFDKLNRFHQPFISLAAFTLYRVAPKPRQIRATMAAN